MIELPQSIASIIQEINTTMEASLVARLQAEYQLSFYDDGIERRLQLNRESRQRRMEDPEYREAENVHAAARQATARQRHRTQSQAAARQHNNVQSQARRQANLETEPGKR